MKREHNEQSQLPSEYRQLEYIQSTGTQYIDTGVVANNDIGILFAMSNLLIVNNDFNFIGCRFYAGERFMVNSYQYNKVTCGFGNWSGIINCNVDLSSDKITEISMNHLNNKKFIVNGVQYTSLGDLREDIGNIWLFGQNIINWSGRSYYKYKIYNTDITNDNDKIRCFIPTLRLSDSKPGLYDLCGSICPLTGTPFYINAGTGDFLFS